MAKAAWPSSPALEEIRARCQPHAVHGDTWSPVTSQGAAVGTVLTLEGRQRAGKEASLWACRKAGAS